jgi:hypothetical protein
MATREEGHRRIRNATVGLAAASLVGTVAIGVTVAVQTTANANDQTTGSTDSTDSDQGGTGFTPPSGDVTKGGTDNSGSTGGAVSGDTGGGTGNSGSGTSGSVGTLPHARSGGSR